MSLERRLQRWVEAGLLSAEQHAAILAFEAGHKRPLFLHAVAGLGGLAIAIGMLSIVASNWDVIPGALKLVIDFALLALGGGAVLRFEQRGPRWAAEVAIVVLYGLVLASIGLIGQVYQLGGEAREALLVWVALTAVLMTRGRGTATAIVWVLGLQATWATWAVWLADHGDALLGSEPEAFALGSLYWAPLLCLVAGWSKTVQARRPRLARVLVDLGMAELVLCASLGTLAFYEHTSDEDWSWVFLTGAVSAALTGWLWTRVSGDRKGAPTRWLLLVLLVCSHVPLLISPGDLDIVAAMSFIGLWLLIAFAAYRSGHVAMLNLATAVVGIRILIVYFEVFGSLLGTGVGLVSGGALTLGLVWLWVRKKRDFAREISETSP